MDRMSLYRADLPASDPRSIAYQVEGRRFHDACYDAARMCTESPLVAEWMKAKDNSYVLTFVNGVTMYLFMCTSGDDMIRAIRNDFITKNEVPDADEAQ